MGNEMKGCMWYVWGREKSIHDFGGEYLEEKDKLGNRWEDNI
jgi:hypothetical protein